VPLPRHHPPRPPRSRAALQLAQRPRQHALHSALRPRPLRQQRLPTRRVSRRRRWRPRRLRGRQRRAAQWRGARQLQRRGATKGSQRRM
jgi:hypothetical protein